MKAKFRSKVPELLTDLADHVAITLTERTAIGQDAAEEIGYEIAGRMAQHWGGQNIYFPMGQSLRLSHRDEQICGEFNGSNHSELARKYGVSLQWIYKIVKTARLNDAAPVG